MPASSRRGFPGRRLEAQRAGIMIAVFDIFYGVSDLWALIEKKAASVKKNPLQRLDFIDRCVIQTDSRVIRYPPLVLWSPSLMAGLKRTGEPGGIAEKSHTCQFV